MPDITSSYKHYRIRSFAILWLVYAGFYFTRKNYSVAMSGMMDSLSIDELKLGVIMTAYLSAYAVGQFVNGMLGDNVGPRVMLGLGMIASALMSIYFGFTTSVIMMAVVWGANGYFQSSGWSNCVKSMSYWFSVKERGTVMGFWCTCYQIGSVAAGIFASFILGRYGWKSVFTAPSIVLLAIAALYLIFHRDSPEKVGLPPIEIYSGEETEEEVKATVKKSSMEVTMQVLREPMVWFMGLSYFCLKFVRYSLMFWLPLYITKQYGYEPEASGYIANIPEIAGFLGAALAGIASDKLFDSKRAPVCAIMLFGLAAACALQAKLSLMGLGGIMAGLSIINFMIYGPDSIMTGAAAMDFGTKEGAATAAGFINGCGSIGAAIQGALLGFIASRFGYDYFFLMFIPLSIFPGLLMLSQWNTRAKHS